MPRRTKSPRKKYYSNYQTDVRLIHLQLMVLYEAAIID